MAVTPNKLRVLRAERRISQLRVAIGAGLGTTRFWAIENGYAQPTAAERAAIARTLNVSESEAWPATCEQPRGQADEDALIVVGAVDV